jgi:chitodextrinase
VTTPDLTAPSDPSAVTAVAGTAPAGVDVSWQASSDNVGVAGYEVSRDGVVIGTSSGTTYQDTAVTGNTTYAYAVIAFDAAGNRSAAGTVSVTTPDLAPPTAPASITATAYDGPPRVALSWGAASDDVGVASYDVVRDGAVVATLAATSWTDTAVAAAQTHTYAVRARDAAGNVGPSLSVNVTVPDQTAPSTPPSFAAYTLSRPPRVVLSWGKATDNVAVATYRLYRNGALLASGLGTSYTDWSVAPSTTYRYYLVAVDAAGNRSAATPTIQVTTPRK